MNANKIPSPTTAALRSLAGLLEVGDEVAAPPRALLYPFLASTAR